MPQAPPPYRTTSDLYTRGWDKYLRAASDSPERSRSLPFRPAGSPRGAIRWLGFWLPSGPGAWCDAPLPVPFRPWPLAAGRLTGIWLGCTAAAQLSLGEVRVYVGGGSNSALGDEGKDRVERAAIRLIGIPSPEAEDVAGRDPDGRLWSAAGSLTPCVVGSERLDGWPTLGSSEGRGRSRRRRSAAGSLVPSGLEGSASLEDIHSS
mmetsp:Transcript_101391/g.175097  ORF Transcript_101391/g.175097 Transcript_101391/m.175097 type:complete len:206 (+) Transcript_101391:619-1236(+)